MSKVTDIAAEISIDPAGLGYAALITAPTNDPELITKDPAQHAINQAIADKLNATDTGRTRAVTSVTKSQVLNAIADIDLSLINNQITVAFQLDNLDPNDPKLITMFTNVFSNTNGTLTNLQALQNETVSRAVEMSWGVVDAGYVAMARMYNGV